MTLRDYGREVIFRRWGVWAAACHFRKQGYTLEQLLDLWNMPQWVDGRYNTPVRLVSWK